jgi:hypothetical protein
MNEKFYVGESYKTVNEKGTFYQLSVKPSEIEKLQGVGKRNEITVAIEPKWEVKKETSPTHDVYVSTSDSALKNREVQLLISKDAILAAPVNEYGKVKLFAASRNKEKMGEDLSNYSVMLGDKTEDGKYQFIGRGYDASTKFGETRNVGQVFKHELGNNGENGKSYNLNLDVKKVQKLDTDEYGNASLGIVAYNAAVLKPDGSTAEELRYTVIEMGSQRANANIEASVSLHLKNTEKTKSDLHTLFDCNVHTVGDDNSYKLIVRDRNPEKIGRDCADLVVQEDKYTPEMKFMSLEERKTAMDAMETIFIGKGWTNDPAKIKLSAADLTQEGLSKAIENNHMTKVIAIIKNAPEVVNAEHVAQAQEKTIIKDAPEVVDAEHVAQAQKRSEGLAKWVVNTYNSKQAPPDHLSNIKFTEDQQAALKSGQAIKVEGMEFKTGKFAGTQQDRWVTWSNKTGKCNLHEKEPALAPKQGPKPDVEPALTAPKPKKAKGISR